MIHIESEQWKVQEYVRRLKKPIYRFGVTYIQSMQKWILYTINTIKRKSEECLCSRQHEDGQISHVCPELKTLQINFFFWFYTYQIVLRSGLLPNVRVSWDPSAI